MANHAVDSVAHFVEESFHLCAAEEKHRFSPRSYKVIEKYNNRELIQTRTALIFPSEAKVALNVVVVDAA